jgi:hypothetical protein
MADKGQYVDCMTRPVRPDPGSVEARGLLHLLVAADHRLLYTVRSDRFRFRTHSE